MKRNIPSSVEELPLQGVGSFFRRSHRATLPKVAEAVNAEGKIGKRLRKYVPTLDDTFHFAVDRDESHRTN